MNRHSLGWRDNLLFASASGQRCCGACRDARLLLGLLLVYIAVGYNDTETLRAEIAAQEESNRALTTTLVRCLNGEARFLSDGPHTDGYGKTATICRKAEEIKL